MSSSPIYLFLRLQVASFALALKGLLGGWGEEQEAPLGTRVIDFGCGSGNLLLPLAALFPLCSFVGIDMKEHAIKLARERVEEAGFGNVEARERFRHSCPLVSNLTSTTTTPPSSWPNACIDGWHTLR